VETPKPLSNPPKKREGICSKKAPRFCTQKVLSPFVNPLKPKVKFLGDFHTPNISQPKGRLGLSPKNPRV